MDPATNGNRKLSSLKVLSNFISSGVECSPSISGAKLYVLRRENGLANGDRQALRFLCLAQRKIRIEKEPGWSFTEMGRSPKRWPLGCRYNLAERWFDFAVVNSAGQVTRRVSPSLICAGLTVHCWASDGAAQRTRKLKPSSRSQKHLGAIGRSCITETSLLSATEVFCRLTRYVASTFAVSVGALWSELRATICGLRDTWPRR